MDERFRYCTFWRRCGAIRVDTLVLTPLAFVDFWIRDQVDSGLIVALWFIGLSVLGAAYSILLHGLRGQTLGKMATGVRVLDLSEAPLTMRQAVLRDIVPLALSAIEFLVLLPLLLRGTWYPTDPAPAGRALLLSSIVWHLWAAAEIVSMLTNRKRRAVHDFIAGSVVVRER